jgi:hypothetical protein
MRHEMLTQRALFCIDVMAKRVMLSQHFVTRVVPPLGWTPPQELHTCEKRQLAPNLQSPLYRLNFMQTPPLAVL